MNDANQRFWNWRKLVLLGFLLSVGIAGVVIYRSMRPRSSFPDHPAGHLLDAGRRAIQKQQFREALASFAKAEAEGGELPAEIVFDRAQAHLKLAETTAAEKELVALLKRDPHHLGAIELLTALLRVEGRNWEIRPYFLELVRQDVFSAANLAAITSNENLAVNRGPPKESQLEQFLTQQSTARGDLLAQLAKARYLVANNDPEEALPLLRKVVEQRPDMLDGQARLGAVLLDTNRLEEFESWNSRLPDGAAAHPDIWLVRGRWLERFGNPRAAARCYWETLRRYPDHPAATYRLSQALFAMNRSDDAAIFAERASEINQVQTAIATGWNPPSNIQSLAERLEKLGRLWESLAWSRLTVEWTPSGEDIGWAIDRVKRLRTKIRSDTPLVLDDSNPALKVDLSNLALPVWDQISSSSASPNTTTGNSSPIRFVNSARDAGVDFSYYNGADPDRAYMFEFSGGGVAVIDYDQDGWPDLYLTQGCDWPVTSRPEKHTDRLFRNLGNGQFLDVTQQAGLQDIGYGEGVTFGDIDNDGWPDLYVANIGLNQLYRNNGDGTFTDITAAAGVAGEQWTLSTLIADLNGDRAPEIYDVNYVGGPDVFTAICLRDNHPTQCFPNQFPGEEDKVYLNLLDGAFRDVTQEAGIIAPDGKGMGIVAADFDGSGKLSLFISNDTTNNFFFLNETKEPGADLRYSEMAISLGLAVSEDGTARSCMGIAIGDVNGDARLDLFVTNFRDEANNLYVQDEGLLFLDRVRATGLHDPGFPLEGWGAQFMDADLDGWMDLAVANGHLDDYPHTTGRTRMPTQFFWNSGEGKFIELPAGEWDTYFETMHLGRSLARLDWNRDGKPDFCVTHVATPFALLTNETAQVGNFLSVHLRGTESSRDAIGAHVKVTVGDRVFAQQLMAGDGFAAANQRHLMFGLGRADRVDRVEVTWPSGLKSSFLEVPINSELMVIEGSPSPEFLSRE